MGNILMTDVWTSVGVLFAIGLVKLTGWLILESHYCHAGCPEYCLDRLQT